MFGPCCLLPVANWPGPLGASSVGRKHAHGHSWSLLPANISSAPGTGVPGGNVSIPVLKVAESPFPVCPHHICTGCSL